VFLDVVTNVLTAPAYETKKQIPSEFFLPKLRSKSVNSQAIFLLLSETAKGWQRKTLPAIKIA